MKLTGLCEKSMWTLKKQLREQSVSDLMVIKSGSGRKKKLAGIEKQILAELESNNYRTRQEILDMIEDKFHISLLFMDASHFVMGCDFLGHIYGKTRHYVKTFSGRKRYNVLGTLDYVSKK